MIFSTGKIKDLPIREVSKNKNIKFDYNVFPVRKSLLTQHPFKVLILLHEIIAHSDSIALSVRSRPLYIVARIARAFRVLKESFAKGFLCKGYLLLLLHEIIAHSDRIAMQLDRCLLR